MADPGGAVDGTVYHGGSLAEARSLFPGAPEPIVDLSTGINPLPYPLLDLPPESFTRLPEPGRIRALEALAARLYGAPNADCVVAAAGTQALLAMVAGMAGPGEARILSPTYAGHGQAARLSGRSVIEVDEAAALAGAALAVVVNPNNPDGRIVSRDKLLELARSLAPDGLLVVDEAFMDVGPPGGSMADRVADGSVLVLRSFGKFFGLAGVRLGFAIAAPHIANRLRAMLGAWAICGPALEHGLAALADGDWQGETRARLAADAVRLDSLFDRHGIAVRGGTSLFRLVEDQAADRLFRRLGNCGIFVRRFPARPQVLRIGLPAGEPAWQRLDEALAGFRRDAGGTS
jgi:cobalamin biosynthetic protein CobC